MLVRSSTRLERSLLSSKVVEEPVPDLKLPKLKQIRQSELTALSLEPLLLTCLAMMHRKVGPTKDRLLQMGVCNFSHRAPQIAISSLENYTLSSNEMRKSFLPVGLLLEVQPDVGVDVPDVCVHGR